MGGEGLSFLLYCIFQNSLDFEIDGLTGVKGQPLALLTHNGLGGVASILSSPQLPLADLATIMTYQRVIDYLHRQQTIIPMRYGCIFDGEGQIVRLLEDRFDEYRTLLEELEGCVEMGIRVLPEEPEKEEKLPLMKKNDPVMPVSNPGEMGRAYLAARKSYYARKNLLVVSEKAVIENILVPFAGIFVRYKAEISTPMMRNHGASAHMLSLYFLVRRGKVEAFRQVFQALTPHCSAKLLLSGPWAPFNFVVP